MKTIEAYLEIMAKKISNKNARETAVEEIRAHLLDQVESLVTRGLTEAEALELTLRAATSPQELGRKLNLAHRSWPFRYPVAVASIGTFAGLFLIGFITVNVMIESYLEGKIANSKVEPLFAERFRRDLDLLKKHPLPRAKSRHKNAHAYLRKYVGMHIGEKTIPRLQVEIYKKRNLKLIWEDKKSLLRTADSQAVKDFNSVWVEGTLAFDHWNHLDDHEVVKAFGRVQHATGLDKIVAYSSYDIPNMGVYSEMASFHALKLVRMGKIQQAEKLLDHAFSLLDSNYTLLGTALARTILRRKNQIASHFKLNWKQTPESVLHAYHRIHWGWTHLFSAALNSSKAFEPWEKEALPELGACSGVIEIPAGNSVERDLLGPSFPFESDHREELDQSLARMKKFHRLCDLDELGPLLTETSPDYEQPLFRQEYYLSSGTDMVPRSILLNPVHIPFVRRLVALEHYNVRTPGYNSIYLNDRYQP